MTRIKILVPEESEVAHNDLEQRIVRMRQTQRWLLFAPELMEFTNEFAQHILNDPVMRRYPDVQALGFWLRTSALMVMKDSLMERPAYRAVPQGLVFHIPPSNVDTMFAYSLFMSLLCGNANIVRAPTQRSVVVEHLFAILTALLQKSRPPLQEQLLIISYDHDATVTETLSRHADVRIIWGGDKTVQAIRSIPLAPMGRELIFPNRFSWMAIDALAYGALSDTQKNALVEATYNDLFWFDQNGCSSPRMIVWRGEVDAKTKDAFYQNLAHTAHQKQWSLDTGASLLKQTQVFSALADYAVTKKAIYGELLTVLTLGDLGHIQYLRNDPCFGGTLFEVTVKTLEELIPFIDRRDQTLTYFGFDRTEREFFVRQVAGRGFDRLVPIGQALSFEPVWDGYDLAQHLTRLVKIGG